MVQLGEVFTTQRFQSSIQGKRSSHTSVMSGLSFNQNSVYYSHGSLGCVENKQCSYNSGDEETSNQWYIGI
jgi:hypothetical protein